MSFDRTREPGAEATAVDETRLAGALAEEAENAGPLKRVDVPRVLRAVTRRRRRRTVRAGLVAAVVAGAVVAAVSVARPDGDSSVRAAGPQEPGYFTCGQPIPWNVVGSRSDGLTLSIESVRRDHPDGQVNRPPWASPDGPPIVTYRVESERDVGLDPTQVHPSVLILRDGVVVGGPLAADEELQRRDSGNYVVPAIGAPLYGPPWRPWPVVEQRQANWWLCDLADWDELWAAPERYSVAVVMTPLATAMRGSGGLNVDYTRLDRPLMMVEVPLSRAQ